MLNKYIFTSYKCQIKIVLLFAYVMLCWMASVLPQPKKQLQLPCWNHQLGGKREGDLEQYDCPAKLIVCHSFFSSSQGNKSYTEYTQLLVKIPYWMESQQAMHVRDIVVRSRVNWVQEYLWHNDKTAVSILDRCFLILQMCMITTGLMINTYDWLKHLTVPSTRPIAVH